MNAQELVSTNQNEQVVLNDGVRVSYVFGQQVDGVFLPPDANIHPPDLDNIARPIPIVTTLPTADGTYGNSLSSMQLTGGATIVPGTWSWAETNPDSIYPTAVNTAAYSIRFTPNDEEISPVTYMIVPSVAKRDIAVTANNQSKRIGSTDPSLTYDVSGFLATGDSWYGALSRVAGETAGTYAINRGTLVIRKGSVDFTDNYNLNFIPGVFTITEKHIPVITVSTIENKIYGDAPFSLVVTPDPEVSHRNNFSFVSTDENVATISDTGEITIVGAGETVIRVTEPGDYDFGPFVCSQTLIVAKRTLSVTPGDRTITYGDDIIWAVWPLSFSGFIAGENESVIVTRPIVSITPATAKTTAGTHTVRASGGVANNYDFNYLAGLLTVEKRMITTVSGLTVVDKIYDGTITASLNTTGYTLEGLVSGDDVRIDFDALTAEFEDKEIGDNKTVVVTDLALIGADSGNYVLGTDSVIIRGNIKETPADTTYTITVIAQAGGTATGGGTFSEGDNIVLRATPASNYDFVGWFEGNVRVSSDAVYSFVISANRTLEARFSLRSWAPSRTNFGTSPALPPSDPPAPSPTPTPPPVPLPPIHAPGTRVPAVRSTNTLVLNGQQTRFPAYLIADYNWLKLRDLAFLLNGTEKQFQIGWNESANTVTITSNRAYAPVVGDELEPLRGDDIAIMPQ
jgi:hypothetical protein